MGKMMKSAGVASYLVDDWLQDLRCSHWDLRGTRAMVLLTPLCGEWAGTYARARAIQV